jgi:hypothetical protein
MSWIQSYISFGPHQSRIQLHVWKNAQNIAKKNKASQIFYKTAAYLKTPPQYGFPSQYGYPTYTPLEPSMGVGCLSFLLPGSPSHATTFGQQAITPKKMSSPILTPVQQHSDSIIVVPTVAQLRVLADNFCRAIPLSDSGSAITATHELKVREIMQSFNERTKQRRTQPHSSKFAPFARLPVKLRFQIWEDAYEEIGCRIVGNPIVSTDEYPGVMGCKGELHRRKINNHLLHLRKNLDGPA